MVHNKSKDHSDKTLFCNRLWGLMEQRQLDTARGLATQLYDAGLVAVNQGENFNSPAVNRGNAIGSVEKKIQAHLKAKTPDKLQGEYVMAYCVFFGCSADYLFGNTDIQSGNSDVRHFCKCTGLSEKAVRRLIEELPSDIKVDLIKFWSDVLDSNVFYGIPLEFHQMCYELGQYQAAQNQIQMINKASKQMDNSDTFVETWRAMMEENYLKEAEPHNGAYHMHLNEILVNFTSYLEMWAEEYTEQHRNVVDDFFFKKLEEKHQESRNRYMVEASTGLQETE